MNKKDIVILCCVALFSVPGVWAQQPLRLSLDECRKMALVHNEALQQADNALRQAELDREIAKTAFLPKFDASAAGAYMLPDMDMMGMEMRMRGTYMAGVNLTQPIYTGGKITTGNRLARIGEETAAEQYHMTRMDVLVEADNAYWTYIAIGRKVRMLESYHAQMDTLHRQTEVALAAGMATENDLLRIETKRSDIRYQLQKVRNGADLCRMSLCHIVGADFDTEIEATDTVFVATQPGGLASGISSGREQIRMARADMLPTVGLGINYMYYGNIKLNGMTDTGGTTIPFSQEFRDGMGIAMLSVQIPIFRWGENRKKVRKAQYELRNAELDLQKNTRLLNIEVQQAIRNVQDGYGLIRTAEKGLRQADENLRVMRNRYAASLAPLTDLLDAQSQWQQAESNLIEAQTQYKIYETEYLRATGKLNF
ncbi:MAG: TolC family protein [Odoribacter splanchnicus]